MAAHYSADALKKAVDTVNAGHTLKEASQAWCVPTTTLERRVKASRPSRSPLRRSARDASAMSYYVGPKKRKRKNSTSLRTPTHQRKYTDDDPSHALDNMADGDRRIPLPPRYDVPDSTRASRLVGTSTPSAPALSNTAHSKQQSRRNEPTRGYTAEDLENALNAVANGAKIKATSRATGIPFSTLRGNIRRSHGKIPAPAPQTPTTPVASRDAYDCVSSSNKSHTSEGSHSKHKYTEDDLATALDAIASGDGINPTSRKMGIPFSTLYSRMKRDRKILEDLGLTPETLGPRISIWQEVQLAKWAKCEASLVRPPTVAALMEFANKVFHLSGGAGTLGSDWLALFLRRNPTVTLSDEPRGQEHDKSDGADEDDSMTTDDDGGHENNDLMTKTSVTNDADDDRLDLIRRCVDQVVAEFERDIRLKKNDTARRAKVRSLEPGTRKIRPKWY